MPTQPGTPLFYVFIDLDDVVADYMGQCVEDNITPDDACLMRGFFKRLLPLGNSVNEVLAIEEMLPGGVYFASAPPEERHSAWTEKAQWVHRNFPDLGPSRLILTRNKGLLGSKDDIIIDDHPEWSGADKFRGTIIRFTGPESWQKAKALIKKKIVRGNSSATSLMVS
jgi:hypothetical protein